MLKIHLHIPTYFLAENSVPQLNNLIVPGTVDKEQKQKVRNHMNMFMRSNKMKQKIIKRFTVEELQVAMKCLKVRIATGTDGIIPEFLHNLRPEALKWLAATYSKNHYNPTHSISSMEARQCDNSLKAR